MSRRIYKEKTMGILIYKNRSIKISNETITVLSFITSSLGCMNLLGRLRCHLLHANVCIISTLFQLLIISLIHIDGDKRTMLFRYNSFLVSCVDKSVFKWASITNLEIVTISPDIKNWFQWSEKGFVSDMSNGNN